MSDFTLFVALIVAVLLTYQAKASPKLPASRTAKIKLNVGDLAWLFLLSRSPSC